MRADIHPKYEKLVATCSCGNVIETRSALGKETITLTYVQLATLSTLVSKRM